MKRTILLLSWISFSLIFVQAQEFDFAFDMGGTGADFGRDIASNRYTYFTSGGYYTTGTHTGTVDFDPSAGVQTRTSAGMQDVYIASYDSAGNLNWVTDFGGSLNDAPNSISVFYNHVYVTGLFRGTVDFDPGAGSAIRTASGDADIFLIEFDWNGNFQWVVTMGGSGTSNTEAGISVIGVGGGCYVTGVFEGTNIDFNPNGSATTLSATGDQNIFLAKYDLSGGLAWAKSLGSTTLDDDGGKGITFDGRHVYVAGSFAGSCDFNPNVLGGTLTSIGGQDGFVASYTESGTYRWARRIGGPLKDEIKSIDVDSLGRIGITGSVFGNVTYSGGSFTTNGGSQDALIAQLSNTGTFQWAYPLGSSGANDVGNTIELTDCGRIFVGGNFCGTADFDPGPGVANLTGPACNIFSPAYTYFMACYDENGNYRWASRGTSSGGTSTIRGLELDMCENLITTGGYNRTQDFNFASSATFSLTPTPFGSTDAFVNKHFIPIIPISVENQQDLDIAIDCANIHKGRDTISFCLPGSGPHVFSLYTGLNYITDDYTIIDGTTQPGWSLGNVVVTGSNISATAYGFRFDGCDHGEVLGMSVRNFPNHGIYAYNADNTTIHNCQVGGNGQDGIRFYNSAYGSVEGSIIGLNASATSADPNGRDGIATNGSADNLQIGGTSSNMFNYIGSNNRYGIYLRTDNCQVEGSYIGTNSLTDFGNGSHGIYIEGDDNRIGDMNANAPNYIAFNGGHGIEVFNSSNYTQNHFWRNAYYCNSQSAIEINIANQGIASPIITLADASGIYGTGVPGGYVEIYAPDTSGCTGNACQGRYFLGSANINPAGVWSITGSFNGGQQVVAIQTDGNLNTSEFSTCMTVQTLLAAGNIQLNGTPSPTGTQLSWEYPTLNQPALFQIERSIGTTHWEVLEDITAETGATWSELTDKAPAPGFNYYRVGMWLEDGKLVYSNVVEVGITQESEIQIYPNPAQDFMSIKSNKKVNQLFILDISGKLVLEKKHIIPGSQIEISHLPAGGYLVKISLQDDDRERDVSIPLMIIK